ncbi:hypothetical protein ACFVR6_03770 [Microbacterium sp. NPDC058021]|uniref:hypothetical protein n=1 Tax=Microbacterium sp. NPDC058021 TaxID=3346306 RepID=UPI0036DE54BD
MPLDAIDPEAGYRAWVEQYLWHIDQLPNVVEASGTVALATHGLKAAQLKERVSGGGYIDNIPVVDGPESRNARAVWDTLRAYLTAASSRIGVEAPNLPPMLPDDVAAARWWAFAANEWLADRVHVILDHQDLAPLEDQLFRLIRRARTQHGTPVVRRQPAELCMVCGVQGVAVDWVTGGDGRATLARTCRECGDVQMGTEKKEQDR